ncbi:DUF6683 family protein [Roseomonas sp. WA12]
MGRMMLSALALAVATLAGGAAAAQNLGWSSVLPSMAGTDVLGLALRQHIQRDARPAPGANPGASPVSANLRYTPDAARRRANLAQFVARSRSADPAGAERLAQLFASGVIIERIGAAIAPLGLRLDDLADAYALWWVAAWQATQGTNPTPSRATMQAVRAQVMRAMATTPSLANADNAGRQALAEALLIQTMLLDGMVEQARRPEERRAIATAAAQGAAGMGLDLSRMRLTETGFVSR